MLNMDEKQMEAVLEKAFTQHLNPFKNKMEKSMGELRNSVQFMSDGFDEQKSMFAEMVSEMKKFKEENNLLKQKLEVFEERLNQIEQKDKEKNLIVAGIPKQNNISIR